MAAEGGRRKGCKNRARTRGRRRAAERRRDAWLQQGETRDGRRVAEGSEGWDGEGEGMASWDVR